MSITSAKTGSTSLSLALENNFMEPIASVLVGSGGTGVIDFLDIPQNYKHLQIRCFYATTSGAGNPKLIFNSDVGVNYTFHQIVGNGSTASSSGGANQSFIYQPYGGFQSYSATIIDILDYTNTNKYKTVKSLGGNDNNNSGSYVALLELMSGVWMSNAPISSLRFTIDTVNFAQYSRFSLYGIKG